MADVIPGISEKEYAAIEQKVQLVAPFVSWVQIEFADNSIVPAQTFFDIPTLGLLMKKYPQLSFEAHVVVASPEKYLKQLVDAGFKRIIIHVEANDPRVFIEAASHESVEVGIAIDAPTEIEQLEPFLDEVDCVLFMTVEAGLVGQPLLPEAVEKIKMVHEQYPDMAIAAKGGITAENASVVKVAGVTRLIVNNYLFHDPHNIATAIQTLKD